MASWEPNPQEAAQPGGMKGRDEMEECGRPGGRRGNQYDRLSRVCRLLMRGDGKTVPCIHCEFPLTFETVTSDRIDPFDESYRDENVWPACFECNDVRDQRRGWRYTGRPRARVTKVRDLSSARRLVGHPRLPREWSRMLARL